MLTDGTPCNGRLRAWRPPTRRLIVSLALALASFAAGFGFTLMWSEVFMVIALAFSAAWAVAVVAGLVVHRWRGLWLLAGAPFALFWPTLIGPLLGAIGACTGCR